MKVLVSCERSGIVRRAFAARGHTVISVDLFPADDGCKWMEDRPGMGSHWTGDIREFLSMYARVNHSMALEGQQVPGFDIAIAHPVCTRLTNAGVRWLHERNLWDQMREGAAFFNFMKTLPAPRIAIENPIMHKYARELCGEFTQSVQPWQFGDKACKRTCWWLYNLPPLRETNVITPPPQVRRITWNGARCTTARRGRIARGYAASFFRAWQQRWQSSGAVKSTSHNRKHVTWLALTAALRIRSTQRIVLWQVCRRMYRRSAAAGF